MTEAKYPSKERVERDGVLVYAEGDDIPVTDAEELKRQGYNADTEDGARTVRVAERFEQDGVLVYAEGDEIPADVADRLGVKTGASDTEQAPTKARGAKKSPAGDG